MKNKELHYIRKLKIDGLFNSQYSMTIEMNDSINCIYGANGSGKTTIINLLVAALSCDVRRLENIKFKSFTVFTAKSKQKKAIKFFSVEKSKTAEDVKSKISYVFNKADSQDTLNVSEFTQTESKELKTIIEKLISANYLPLNRFNESDVGDSLRERDFLMRSFRTHADSGNEEIELLLDPVRRMLVNLERKFKDEFSQKQKAIRTDLENLKDKVLEKLLIDDALVEKVSETTLRKVAIAKDDYKSTKSKLDYIGLKLPNDKLEKHFSVMAEISERLTDRQGIYIKSMKDGPAAASDEARRAILKEYSDVLRIYRSIAPFHNRLLSIISDVEESAAYRLSQQKLFNDFQDSINLFFVNKKFEFTDVGGFSFSCKGVPTKIEELSSGEKHIVALLGKVALSKSAGAIFIADEPELSLHLSWQRKLLPAIQKLAPDMQIIVATHAPAIIPSTAKTIDLDEMSDVTSTI